MLKWWLKRRLGAFERTYNYDMSYAREILDADLDAMIRISKVMGMAHYRKDLPPAPWYAAGIAGTLAADCGPCTQLVATMAEREGVDPGVLRAILQGDEREMPDDVALAHRFARAVLEHDQEADSLRDQVVERWGRKALISLSFSIAGAGMFPTIKYALGHGRACTRVTVGGQVVATRQSQGV